MRKLFKPSVLGVAVAAAASGNIALAQDVDTGRLEEVMVTAERTSTSNLQETPIAMTALSTEDLREFNIVNFADLGTFTPGLQIGSRPGGGNAEGNIVIRGIGVDSSATQQAVGIYVDDVYFSARQGNLLGLLDVDRVEVLRGPQGTLFGRNTIAGAIQYVTAQPTTEGVEGYINGIVGNFDRRAVEGAINIPLTDTLAVRLAMLTNERDGYVRDLLNNINRGGDENLAMRARLRWEPTDDLSVDLRIERVEYETNGRPTTIGNYNPDAQFVNFAKFGFPFPPAADITPALLAAEAAPLLGHYRTAGYNARDEFQFEFDSWQANISYRVNDYLTLKSITSQQEYSPRIWIDFDGTPAQILRITPSFEDIEIFTQEFQAFGTVAEGFVDYTFGVYYYDEENTEDPNQSTILGLVPGPPNAPQQQNIESTALFGRIGLNFTENLTVDLGWRYTREDVSNEFLYMDGRSASDFTDNSPYVGVNYRLSDDHFLYAKVAKGFRAGGTVLNSNLPGFGNAFDPEENWSYEIGARLEFPSMGLRINPTVFLQQWSDIQFNQLSFDANPPAVTTLNAGDADIFGIELEALWAATDNLEFHMNATWTDAEYTEVDDLITRIFPGGFISVPNPNFPNPPFPNFVVPVNEQIIPNISLDTDLQRTPELTYNIGGRYTFDLAGGANIVASATYSWTDEQRSSVTIVDGILMPSYGLLTARLQYNSPDDQYMVALFGTNLTDEEYLLGGQGFDAAFNVGQREQVPGRPLEFGLELRFNF